MPQLAPKRNCAECGKPVGRRWKDYTLCGSCTRTIMEQDKDPKESDKAEEMSKDRIPY